MDTKNRYDKIISEVFELDENAINEDMTRETTDKWDSLLHLTLVTAIEDEFDFMMDTEDILNFNSYRVGLEIISKYVSDK